MEKTKIVLVEDSKIQIEWAKKELKEFELIVCENFEEYWKNCPEDGDYYLISDLFLPCKRNENPDYQVGLNIFERALEDALENESDAPKGATLISNIEHHRGDWNDQCRKALSEFKSRFGNFTSHYFPPVNCHSFLDERGNSGFYSHFWIDGSPKEIDKDPNFDWRCKEAELLKPFKRIVEGMIKG